MVKLSDYVAMFLKDNDYVFGYQGGAVTHLVDSIYNTDGIKFVLSYHEQGAAFAAEGYARASENKLGVAIATSGPGATNLITGIGSAFFDSIPCMYITGQVNTYEYKGDKNIRQLGFQETDIVQIVTPITKYATRITDKNKIKYELEKAKYIALDGRKGPVVIDIPMDIQRADINIDELESFIPEKKPDIEIDINKVTDLINNSQRPIILVGGGVRSSGACKLVEYIANKLNIPVVSSLMGKDSFDNSSNLYFGMIGAYGSRYANIAVANSDLIIALGTRLDSRQTGTNLKSFARMAKIIRVDIDSNELARTIKRDELSFNIDLLDFLNILEKNIESINIDTSSFIEFLSNTRKAFSGSENAPNYLMSRFSEFLKDDSIVCTDVGQNQMWAAQSLNIKNNARFLTSGGMGAMGFSIPCAIGAYYAQPDKDIYAFCGDGGAQINIQELQLIKKNKIPIKIIIFNNDSLGMIRHFQEMYFNSKYYGTIIDYKAPDFLKIANAYGIDSISINCLDDFHKAAQYIFSGKPVLVEVKISQITYVYPKLAVNRPIEDQEPLLERPKLYENMIIPPDDVYDNMKTYIITTLNRLKNSKPIKIPIDDIGFLVPITKDYRENFPNCAERLSTWRNKYPNMAATSFIATKESTENWLDNLVINKEDRLLFLIVPNLENKFSNEHIKYAIGHIGLANFDYVNRSCEVDAVIRGENNYKGIMSKALKSMIQWSRDYLCIKNIYLRVMKNNYKAISFYEKNGFTVAFKESENDYLLMESV